MSKILIYILLALGCISLHIGTSLRSVIFTLLPITIIAIPDYRTVLPSLIRKTWFVAVVIFLSWVLLANLWSEASFKMMFIIDKRYLKLLYLPLFVAVLRDARARAIVLHASLFSVLSVCIISILAFFHLPHFTTIDPTYIFRNRVETTIFTAYLAFVAAFLAMQTQTKRLVYVYGLVCFILCFQILWISGGRMGYVLFICFASIWMGSFLSWRQTFKVSCMLILALGLTYNYSPTMQQRISETTADLQLMNAHRQSNTSAGLRLQFHGIAKQLFKQHPLIGNGTGGFAAAILKNDHFKNIFLNANLSLYSPDPHSQYWVIAAEQGIIGLMLLFYILVSLFNEAKRLEATKPLLYSTILALVIGQTTETLLFDPLMVFFFELMLAVILGQLYANN